MMNEELQIIINKIGQKIRNVNELSIDNINKIAETIPEWKKYKYYDEGRFLFDEEIFNDALEDGMENKAEKVCFTLKDGSKWYYVNNYLGGYKCINHPLFNPDLGTELFINKEDNVILCDECREFLKIRNDITSKYNFDDRWDYLFPKNWTDKGIEKWCKKRIENQRKYEKEQEEKYKYLEYAREKLCSTCYFEGTKGCMPDWHYESCSFYLEAENEYDRFED